LIPKGQKYDFESLYRYFYDKPENDKILRTQNYVSQHRAIDDAYHEAELLYLFIKSFKFPLTYQARI